MNEEREKLSEQIHKIYCKYYFNRFGKEYHTNGEYSKVDEATKEADRMIADFIIADRKRICEPLIEFINKNYGSNVTANKEISETLNRAGLGDGK